MTVEQMFTHEKITKGHLEEIQEESTYWMRAGTFVIDNWASDFNTLSPAQAKWLNSIYDDMVEKRIMRKSVFAE